jgi:hypothetical protein
VPRGRGGLATARGQDTGAEPPAAGVGAEPAWRRHLAWAAVVAAYLVVFPYFRAVNNPNENVRVWATRAIAHHGTFVIDDVIRAWGDVGDRAIANGHRYSSKAPGTTLLGVPVHFVHDRLARAITGASPGPRATTWALRVFTVILPLALFLLYFARRVEAETASPWARDLLVVGLGLGTMFYPYGLTFVGHAQSAALLFLGFALLLPAAKQGGSPAPAEGRRLGLAGAFTALSVVFEYQTLFAAALVAGYAILLLRRRALPFFLGALGPALLLATYHTALFGRPWELPYAHLDDPGFTLYHHGQGFLGLGRPRARVLVAAFAHVDYGLFVFSPFLAVGLGVALWAAVRRGSRPQALIVLATAAMAIFLAGMANWRGGWTAGGPRYIAAVVPLLTFAIALQWRDLFGDPGGDGRRRALRVGLAGLVLYSVVICGLSGAIFPHFPVQLDNPIFDLVLPLLEAGYVPHSLGTALGLGGIAALIPLGAVFAVAVVAAAAPARAPRREKLASAATALGLAAALLAALGAVGRRPSRQEDRALASVMRMWEPPPAGASSAEGERHGNP